MKLPGTGGRVVLVVAVLAVSYCVGRPLYAEVQSRLQREFAPFNEMDSMPATSEALVSDSGLNPGLDKNSSANEAISSAIRNATQEVQELKHFEVNKAVEAPSENVQDTSLSSKDQHPKAGSDTEVEVQTLPPRPLHASLKMAIWESPQRESVMPPQEEFALRREMVEFRAKENVIVVTFANHAFVGFVRTWVKSLTDKGVNNILVGAMDTSLLKALYWEGVPTFDMGSHMKTNDVGWGSPTFHKMGREKVILVNAFLALGFEVLMCDTDMAWIRNPLPYMSRYPAADVLTSSDDLIHSVHDESLERWKVSFGVYNIGINHWRPTVPAKRFAKEWMDLLLWDDKIWDQNGFNDLMRKVTGPNVQNSSGLFYAYDGTLKLGILPVSIFCSGHTYFIQASYKLLGLQPYAVHTTFQYAGTEGKRHRLREAKLFFDPPEYYNVPGGFVSYVPSLPEELMRRGVHSVETHFRLVNHQLVEIRNALAIASILNRTLVMPEIWCRFDRLWFPHPGVLPGTDTQQPFLCPMDHVFEINMWFKDLSESEFGPPIRFREYSFLDNPRLPAKVKSSTLKVALCEAGSEGCDQHPSKVKLPGSIRLPMNSTDEQLLAAFSSFADAELIEFSSMLGAFQGFSNKAAEAQFSNRVKLYTGIWCCVDNATPGHIWYDIYWDQKPGWTPRPPANREEDHQPW